MSAIRPIHVLLIEDNPGDALLISTLLKEADVPLDITVAKNGQIALDLLTKAKDDGSVFEPDFVILDLNLPKVHGFEILGRMRSSPTLRSVPVVVMTGSLNREDEVRARKMGVTDYRIKPSVEAELDETCLWFRRYLTTLVLGKRSDGAQKAMSVGLDAFTAPPRGRPATGPSLPTIRGRPDYEMGPFKPF